MQRAPEEDLLRKGDEKIDGQQAEEGLRQARMGRRRGQEAGEPPEGEGEGREPGQMDQDGEEIPPRPAEGQPQIGEAPAQEHQPQEQRDGREVEIRGSTAQQGQRREAVELHGIPHEQDRAEVEQMGPRAGRGGPPEDQREGPEPGPDPKGPAHRIPGEGTGDQDQGQGAQDHQGGDRTPGGPVVEDEGHRPGQEGQTPEKGPWIRRKPAQDLQQAAGEPEREGNPVNPPDVLAGPAPRGLDGQEGAPHIGCHQQCEDRQGRKSLSGFFLGEGLPSEAEDCQDPDPQRRPLPGQGLRNPRHRRGSARCPHHPGSPEEDPRRMEALSSLNLVSPDPARNPPSSCRRGFRPEPPSSRMQGLRREPLRQLPTSGFR